MSFIDNPLFLIPFTSGLIFIIAGWIMKRFPPKKINFIYGYRTRRSMKNQEIWDFAQQFSAKYMMIYGFYLSLSGVLGMVYRPESFLGMILGISMMIFMVALLVYRTEKELRSRFGK